MNHSSTPQGDDDNGAGRGAWDGQMLWTPTWKENSGKGSKRVLGWQITIFPKRRERKESHVAFSSCLLFFCSPPELRVLYLPLQDGTGWWRSPNCVFKRGVKTGEGQFVAITSSSSFPSLPPSISPPSALLFLFSRLGIGLNWKIQLMRRTFTLEQFWQSHLLGGKPREHKWRRWINQLRRHLWSPVVCGKLKQAPWLWRNGWEADCQRRWLRKPVTPVKCCYGQRIKSVRSPDRLHVVAWLDRPW